MGFLQSFLLIMSVALTPLHSHADTASCVVPLNELLSEPAVDLLGDQGVIDQDRIIDLIKAGKDSSLLEPQLSDLYVGRALPVQEYSPIAFPKDNHVNFDVSLAGTSGLVRARVKNIEDPSIAYQLQFSLDTHATLARNALFRKLGYAIPTPRYYPKLSVTFKSLDERDTFLDSLADNTLTSRGRWVVGGIDEVNKNQLTLTFQDVALESAIITVPALHWGILTREVLQGRRSIRALIVPLTLLEIPESVNMYSIEAAKIFNGGLVLSRPNADSFKDGTSLGDVKWIARKIAKLTRQDWTEILKAGFYPADIEALLIEKTLGRVNQFMKVIELKEFSKIKNQPKISVGKVVNGKATQELYDGYALRFAYGDPESPLRPSELARFFTLQMISSGLSAGLSKANTYLQAITPDDYVKQHQQDTINDFHDHILNHPNEPYSMPITAWGGPIFGVNFNASRNIVSGTYYGSTSQVQLVDSISAGVSLGAFVGISGLNFGAVSDTVQVQYVRSYVHVRPVPDIKTAFKDNWAHLLVPLFLAKLSKPLVETDDHSAGTAMEEFLGNLKTGEMFIINDGVTTSNQANVKIPLGALMGGVGIVTNISESISATTSYAILSRTTLYKDEDGLHVYLTRMKSGQFEFSMDTQFFIRLVSFSVGKYKGTAHTKAYLFPEKFDKTEDQQAFMRAMRTLVRHSNPSVMEEEFDPYLVDHKVTGKRIKIGIGPFSFTKRENFHELLIQPPPDKEGRYDAKAQQRSVIEGQVTKIKGTDPYGFAGSLVSAFVPYVSIGNGGKGDDPSSNFLGRSNTLTIGSQMETTPGRENRFISTLSRSFRGWTMKKSKLFKLLDKIQRQIGNSSQSEALIDREEFTQTDKVQAYNVLWNVMIYEKGIQKIFDFLDLRTLHTKQVHQMMINLMGIKEYQDWCSEHGLAALYLSGPYALEVGQQSGSYTEYQNGQSTTLGCVTPWMRVVYEYRSILGSQPELLATDLHDRSLAIKKIKQVNRLLSDLEDTMSFDTLFKWIGSENAFFQAKISGFRTQDENGDNEYFSNTIGKLDPDVLTGPMSDIQDATQIQMNELQARYLSGGF